MRRIKNRCLVSAQIEIDESKYVSVDIDLCGIQRDDIHRIEEEMEKFLYSVNALLKQD